MGLKMGAGSSTAGAGELQVISIIASSAPGLSPLTRGTHMNVGSDRVFTRFIPAGAGNTKRRFFSLITPAVYPRWRGEHMVVDFFPAGFCGLSPLARGTHPVVRVGRMLSRFIPAGAGNTATEIQIKISITVYPRWRGEHESTFINISCTGGLSPLARGTRDYQRGQIIYCRFIPAGAGNT